MVCNEWMDEEFDVSSHLLKQQSLDQKSPWIAGCCISRGNSFEIVSHCFLRQEGTVLGHVWVIRMFSFFNL